VTETTDPPPDRKSKARAARQSVVRAASDSARALGSMQRARCSAMTIAERLAIHVPRHRLHDARKIAFCASKIPQTWGNFRNRYLAAVVKPD
jgi:hypothetical protein